MKIRIRLFALAKDICGRESVEVVLPAEARIGDLRTVLKGEFPALSTLLGSTMFAVDNQYVGDDFGLKEGCEVACIPPVSGG